MSTPRPHKSWCSQSNVTMCNCRFPSGDDYIPGHHGPAPEPGACVFCGKRCYSRSPCAKRKEAQGVAAPLESTARDKDIEQLERERDRVGQEFGHVRWADAEKQPDGSYTTKLSGERFLAQQGFADSRNYSATELGPLLEAYAAAVSKNLQEKLAKLKLTHEFAELHIAELEKEITALRETK